MHIKLYYKKQKYLKIKPLKSKIMEDCIFCKIAKGEIPHNKVYEDDHTVAFLDISPATPKGGHILVIPKKHYELITDVPDKELNSIISIIKKLSAVLLKLYPGLNIIQNNKKVAGQAVPHTHFHLIPRYEGDNIKINYWETHKYKPGEDKEIADKIKTLLK